MDFRKKKKKKKPERSSCKFVIHDTMQIVAQDGLIICRKAPDRRSIVTTYKGF